MERIQQALFYNQKSKDIPFGYSVNEYGALIVHEDEAMLVRGIFRLFLLSKSYLEVCKEINNSENFPNHPYMFTVNKIETILHNEFYAPQFFI